MLKLQKVSQKTLPDASLVRRNGTGEIVAQCSLWWQSVPPDPDHRLGLIGNYAATDTAAAMDLLMQACGQLAAEGCTLAVGPMNGNTWQPYRFVTERGDEPSFFLEPNHPETWPQHFIAQGFKSLADYYSTLTTDLTIRDADSEAREQRMADLGVTIRALRMGDFREDLGRIYEVSAQAFQRNFLYTPIGPQEFISLYEPLKPFVQPELVLMAEQRGRLIGYLFAVPNVLQVLIDTFIIKTVAVLPEQQFAGLGSLMVARSHEIAAARGYKRAIHALMHETNKSRRISQHYSRPMRRYSLLARAL
ncbi:MAG: GNAT family N-acetyltransferase [Acidobacteria bacterium]|nr:GNAT family N-acetyltransferase [Acidobacteriota bacterium]